MYSMKRLLVLAVSIIISLLIAEVVLHIVYPPKDTYYIWQPNLYHVFKPDSSIFPGIAGNKSFTINSSGTRGDLFTDAGKNYVCLGGSTTECLYLDDNETWARVAQGELGEGYTISSLGKSGVTTREHYLHIKYTVKHLEHVKGVILMAGINDLMKHLSHQGVNDYFHFTQQIEDSLVNTIFLKRSNEGNTWWRRTALFRLAQSVYHKYKQQGVTWQNVQDDTGIALARWRKHRQTAPAIIDTLPDMGAALNEYERNLQLIYDEAIKQKLDLVCVSQAAIYQDSLSGYEHSLLWMGGIGPFQTQQGLPYYSTKALRQGLDMYNERLRQFCTKCGIHFLDADAALPRDTSVFYDDCHFNQNGARLLGIYIAKELRK